MNFEVRVRKQQQDNQQDGATKPFRRIFIICMVGFLALTIFVAFSSRGTVKSQPNNLHAGNEHQNLPFTDDDLKFFTGSALLKALRTQDKTNIQELIKNIPFLHPIHQAEALELIFLECTSKEIKNEQQCILTALEHLPDTQAFKIAFFLQQRSKNYNPIFIRTFRAEVSKSQGTQPISWKIQKHNEFENGFIILFENDKNSPSVPYDSWTEIEGKYEMLTREYFDSFSQKTKTQFLRIQNEELFIKFYPNKQSNNSSIVEATSEIETFKFILPNDYRNSFFINSAKNYFEAEGTMEKIGIFLFKGTFYSWNPTIGSYYLVKGNKKLECSNSNENSNHFNKTLFRVGLLNDPESKSDWTYGCINLSTGKTEGFFVHWNEAYKSAEFSTTALNLPTFFLSNKMEFKWKERSISVKQVNLDWKNKSILYQLAHVLFIPCPFNRIAVVKVQQDTQITKYQIEDLHGLLIERDMQYPAFFIKPEGEIEEILGQSQLEVILQAQGEASDMYTRDKKAYEKVLRSIFNVFKI
jgi:hypothetical protein